MAANALAAPVPGTANPYVGPGGGVPTRANAVPPNIMAGEEHAGTPQNALAMPVATLQPPAVGPSAEYNAQFAKSMAAARGALAAQMANQLAEIQAAQAAGTKMAGAMPGQYNALQGAENKSLAGIAASADKGAAATGIKSLGSAAGETNMIGNAGGLASAFEAGQAPLLAQGVGATAAMNRNALAIAQAQANEQLDEQQASFDAQRAAAADQERFQQQQQELAWSRDPNNPESPSYKAALTLKGLNPDGTLTKEAQANAATQSAQDQLDKDKITAFTGAQAHTVRTGPTYKFIDQATGGDPTKIPMVFNNQELQNPGMKLAIQVWLYDHGINPVTAYPGQGRIGGGPGSNGPSGLTNALGAAAQWENTPVFQVPSWVGGNRRTTY